MWLPFSTPLLSAWVRWSACSRLLRNEGCSFGVTLVETLQERRNQFHTARMGDYLDPFNPETTTFLKQTREFFYQITGDAA